MTNHHGDANQQSLLAANDPQPLAAAERARIPDEKTSPYSLKRQTMAKTLTRIKKIFTFVAELKAVIGHGFQVNESHNPKSRMKDYNFAEGERLCLYSNCTCLR